MGVGIIGALASILSSVLVGSPPAPAEKEELSSELGSTVKQELANIKSELAEVRQLLENISKGTDKT